MSLQRGEGSHAKNLLTQIAQAFPQAIYYSLRTMVLCLREFAFKVVQVSAQIGFAFKVVQVSAHLGFAFKVVQVSAR